MCKSTVALTGLIAALGCTTAASKAEDALADAQRKSACVQAHNILNAVDLYQISTKECPEDLAAVVGARFLEADEADPWGQPYVLSCHPTSLRSGGPDRAVGNTDDVIATPGKERCE